MTPKKENSRLSELAGKWKKGSITAAEQAEFNQWYDSFDDTLLEEVSSESVQELKGRLYNNILRSENIEVQQPAKTINLWYRIAAAAVVLVVLSIGIYFYAQYTEKEKKDAGYYVEREDVKPGGNKALLTLADGTTITLTDADNGELAEQNGVSITKTKDGQLVYHFKGSANGSNANGIELNTISTPKGGQYQVNLPDGTKVWLNAASSLKFPVSFSRLKERKVELNGEAYFEVSKDKTRPFKVSSAQQEVEVLGTHFNINTYKNESSIKTTLLEGSVKLHVTAVPDIKLKPGEQAVLKGDVIDVNKVNTEDVVAWKKGNFQFNDESLISIMKQLERWYDVEVDYSTIPDTRYNGFISRDVNLSQVLRNLEVTGNLKFKIENKVIKVYK
jgi:transmembrane sensor